MAQDDKLDDATLGWLRTLGLDPTGYTRRKLENPPSNTAGIPNLLAYDIPDLTGTNVSGLVQSKVRPGTPDRMFLEPGATARSEVVGHETEHLLARRGLGTAAALGPKFDELIGRPEARDQFVRAAIAAAPHLEKKYGIKNAYFTPLMYDMQGGRGQNLLYEQLASLAGVEAQQGVDLTKDPVLRKTLFKDKDVRETYNAITGLRQTRLDAKDLPPYTRQPEKEPDTGALQKLKQLIGFANGGMVPRAGNRKDI